MNKPRKNSIVGYFSPVKPKPPKDQPSPKPSPLKIKVQEDDEDHSPLQDGDEKGKKRQREDNEDDTITFTQLKKQYSLPSKPSATSIQSVPSSSSTEQQDDKKKSITHMKAGFLFPSWLISPLDFNKNPKDHPEYH